MRGGVIWEKGTGVPKMPSQTPGLTITKTACTSDASVVMIDMEKIENKRKRSARTRTPLEIYRDSFSASSPSRRGKKEKVRRTNKGVAIKMASEMAVTEKPSA